MKAISRDVLNTFIVKSGGFTYVTLLFLIVVIGIALSVTGEVWSTTSKRELEEELIFRGDEIRKAIGRFYVEGPGGAKQFPRELKALIKDPRFQATKRYLRKIYEDPVTGKADWHLIKEKDGTIIGVKSSSNKEPIKKANFPSWLSGLGGKAKYSDWEFVYSPEKKTPAPPQAAPQKEAAG